MNKNFSTKDMCLIGVFAALICVFGQLSIPMPNGVPLTLQTFIIMFTGIILGAKKGCIASCIYILLGAVGLPVFSNMQGGLGVLFGPTGGFILSFPILAYLSGKGAEKSSIIPQIIYLLIGVIINYIAGIIMFTLVTNSSLLAGFTACVLPFIPSDFIKSAMAIIFGRTLKNRLVKSNLL